MATIAHLANFYTETSGGLRTAVDALTTEYVRAGHRVHVIVPGATEETRTFGAVTMHRVVSRRLPRSGGYRVITSPRRVRALLDEIRPDGVELSDRLTLLGAADWARAAGVPSTLIAHERVDGVVRSFAPFAPATTIADRLNASAAARVDTVVCTTDFAAAEFERIQVPTRRVPLGVDLHTFHPQRRSTVLRRQFPETTLLVLASRLSKEKRPEFAIEVLDACRAMGINARLVVMGHGPLEGRMIRLSEGRACTVLGHVSSRVEVAQVLATADAVLAPGPIETFGLAALEALACGTPVICNEDSAIREVLGSEAGFPLPLIGEAWAEAVGTVLLNSEDERARSRARAEEFPWRRAAEGLLAALHCEGPAPEEEPEEPIRGAR